MQFIRKIFRPKLLLPISFFTSTAFFYPYFTSSYLKKIENEGKLNTKQGDEKTNLEENVSDKKRRNNSSEGENNKNQTQTQRNEDSEEQKYIKIENEEQLKQLSENQKKFISSLNSLNFDSDRLIIDEDPKGELLTEYSSARNSYHEGVCPMIAFYPKSTEEVSKVMKLCFEHNVPVIGCGSGTNLEGSIIPTSR